MIKTEALFFDLRDFLDVSLMFPTLHYLLNIDDYGIKAIQQQLVLLSIVGLTDLLRSLNINRNQKYLPGLDGLVVRNSVGLANFIHHFTGILVLWSELRSNVP